MREPLPKPLVIHLPDLPRESRDNSTIAPTIRELSQNQFIRASDPDSDFVRVSHTDSGLLAERRDFWKLEVKMQWNPATLQCDLMMDGEARPLDYVSQRAVGDFLFEDWCA